MFQVRRLLCAGEAPEAGASRRGTLDLLVSGAQPQPAARLPQATPPGPVIRSNTPDQPLLVAADGTLVAPAGSAGRSPLLAGLSAPAIPEHQLVQEPSQQVLAAEQGNRVGPQAATPLAKGLQGLANRLAGQQALGRQAAKAPGRGLAAAEAEAGGGAPPQKPVASPAAAKPEVVAKLDLPSPQAPALAQNLQLQQPRLQQPAEHSEQELSGELSFAPAGVESPSQGAMEGRAERSTLDILSAQGQAPGEQLSKKAPARSVDKLGCGPCTGGDTTAAGLKVLLPGTSCLGSWGQLRMCWMSPPLAQALPGPDIAYVLRSGGLAVELNQSYP